VECVEYIPSLVAEACFLPGRAKDLSAPLVSTTSSAFLKYEDFDTFCTKNILLRVDVFYCKLSKFAARWN